jgi:hypothetical protein
MQVAIPKDLENPYAITVQTPAVDDQCGSITISQPMRYVIVNVNCMINPGILSDLCRELRVGHKAVVNELSRMRTDTNAQLATMRVETNQQLVTIQKEMATLVTRLTTTKVIRSHVRRTTNQSHARKQAVHT